MSRRNQDGRLNTPPPEELDRVATIGYVHLAISQYQRSCQDEQTESRNQIWGELTKMKSTQAKIFGGLKLAAWVVPLLAAITVGSIFPMVKWAVEGAISKEFDSRLSKRPLTVDSEKGANQPKTTAEILGSLIPSAEASQQVVATKKH